MNGIKKIITIAALSFVLGFGSSYLIFTNTGSSTGYTDDDTTAERMDQDREDAMGDAEESFNSVRDTIDTTSGTGTELTETTTNLKQGYTDITNASGEVEQGIEGDLELARRIRTLMGAGTADNR